VEKTKDESGRTSDTLKARYLLESIDFSAGKLKDDKPGKQEEKKNVSKIEGLLSLLGSKPTRDFASRPKFTDLDFETAPVVNKAHEVKQIYSDEETDKNYYEGFVLDEGDPELEACGPILCDDDGPDFSKMKGKSL